jgi:hypothetical protein
VVEDGFTSTDVPVTAPTPALIVRVVAPVTDQPSVLEWPVDTIAGVAVKLAMVGRLPTMTVSETVVEPMLLVAVRV